MERAPATSSAPRILLVLAACCAGAASSAALASAQTAAGSGTTEARKPGDPSAKVARAPRLRTRLEFPTANGGEAKPIALLPYDFDGDGRDELLVTTRGPGSLQLLRGLSPELDAPRAPSVLPLEDYPLGPVFLGARPKPGAARVPIVVAPRASRPSDGVQPSIVVVDAAPFARGEPAPVLRTIALERRPRALASGDLGNDGEPDVAIANLDDELLVFGAGEASSRVKLGATITTCLHVLADGSGIVSGSQAERTVALWTAAKGASGFTFTRAASAGLFERARAPGEPDALPRDLDEFDVDQDGDTELVVAGGDESVWIFGHGTPGGVAAGLARPAQRFTTSSIPIDLEHHALGAGKGHELGVLGLLGLSYSLYHAAPEGFSATGDAYAGQSPVDLAFADLDGDGATDLALANTDAGRVSVVFGDGSGGFQNARFANTGRTPHSLAAGDLTGDGFPEVLVLDAVDGTLSIAPNAKGVLEHARRKALAKSADALRVADLDGDGKLEAAFVVQREHDAVLTVLFGDGGELFERAAFPPVPLGASPGDLLLQDFDSDGRVDALATDPQTNQLILLHNGTPKNANPTNPASRADFAFDARIQAEVIAGPKGLAPLSAPSEVAVALAGPGARIGVAILRLEKSAEGALSWLELSSIDTEFLPLSISSGDLDGDGRIDLAVLVAEKNADSTCFVQPCLRQEDGNWRKLERFQVGYRPYRVACGDLDGDGKAEILVSAQNSHHVELWSPRAVEGGALAFVRAPDLGLHAGCLDLLVFDVDRDGRLDVIVANGFSNDLGVVALR
ncbi:MAG: VCBS repeat-containing protein [Planctomycetes bacterium]|nr:VCBS repeat-containing protein [Planctomycetota bacterium]